MNTRVELQCGREHLADTINGLRYKGFYQDESYGVQDNLFFLNETNTAVVFEVILRHDESKLPELGKIPLLRIISTME